jgi:hypothetical protein
MTVDSINPGGSRIQQRRVNEKRAVAAVEARERIGESDTSGATGDRVEISDAARRLAAGAGGVSGSTRVQGALTPERIAAVTKRINEGYYDREGIREETARRVLKDL